MSALGYPFALAIILILGIGSLAVAARLRWWYRHFRSAGNLQQQTPQRWLQLEISRLLLLGIVIIMVGMAVGATVWQRANNRSAFQAMQSRLRNSFDKNAVWQAPDWALLPGDPQRKLVAYGRDLVAHTTDYFGDKGLVRPHSINGLNCQNCHLEAGSKPFGNNYSGVAANYPKMRARSGKMESVSYRINDCIQRSLNGSPLDTNSREMQAMIAYITWLGANVPAKVSPKGVGLVDVPFLDRPADPALGAVVYTRSCASCHGPDGQGLPLPDSPRFYPPLWGDRSYAESAGLFRMSRLAGYVKANMPFGVNYLSPQLSDPEAWDVAAFINSQPRPGHRFLAEDWPDVSKKNFDHPFGPYADPFPEQQHKYGPFQPILDFYKAKAAAVAQQSVKK